MTVELSLALEPTWLSESFSLRGGRSSLAAVLTGCDLFLLLLRHGGQQGTTACSYVGRPGTNLAAIHQGSFLVGSKCSSSQAEVLWSSAAEQVVGTSKIAGNELVYVGAGFPGWRASSPYSPRELSARTQEPTECSGDLPTVLQLQAEPSRDHRELSCTGDFGS